MQKYNLQVDIWSLGVVFYVCLCGYPPFADEVPWHNLPIEEQITEGKWRFDPGEPWDSISQGAKDLVSGCLKVVPTERIGIKAAVAHTSMQLNQAESAMLAKLIAEPSPGTVEAVAAAPAAAAAAPAAATAVPAAAADSETGAARRHF